MLEKELGVGTPGSYEPNQAQASSHVRRSSLEMYTLMEYTMGWRFGVAVTRWSRSTQLLYIEPG